MWPRNCKRPLTRPDFSIYDDYEFAIFIGGRQPGDKAVLEIVLGALDGPITVGDVTVVSRTAGLNPPKRFKIEVTFGDWERARSTVYRSESQSPNTG